MRKKSVFFAIALTAVALGLASIAPMAIADPGDKKNPRADKDVLEFHDADVVDSSSTTTICHMPPGNPDNARTLVVGTSSLTAHLDHGDERGSC